MGLSVHVYVDEGIVWGGAGVTLDREYKGRVGLGCGLHSEKEWLFSQPCKEWLFSQPRAVFLPPPALYCLLHQVCAVLV